MPSQYVNLMPEDQDLGCQRGPRSEQQYQRRPDQAASFSHKIETLRDSASLASRIRFPTGTTGKHHYTGVKSERIERAIADDLAFLAAHPVRQSNRRRQS
jgi:hypothetical protein